MELLAADDKDLVVKMSKVDLANIMTAFETIRQDYDNTDLSMLQMTEPRVVEVIENLRQTLSQVSTVQRNGPNLRAVS